MIVAKSILTKVTLVAPLLVILLCQVVEAQVYFNNYQVEQGLSNNAILCSAQDADGFMWFGTRDGLNRFDGYNFKHYYSDPESSTSLGSNFIHSILVSKSNDIWIGTDQGIYVFDPTTETFSYLSILGPREVTQIKQDSLGNFWFLGTSQLFHYEQASKKLTQKTKLSNGHVSHFCIDRNNQIWYGVGTRLIAMDKEASYSLQPLSTPSNRIEKLHVDGDNNIWIGTSRNGLFKWSRNSKKVTSIISNTPLNSPLFVRDILPVDENHLWVATEAGLFTYDIKANQYTLLRHEIDNPWSLSDNAIYTLTMDHQHGIWIGTFFGGINYHHPYHNFFEKIFPRYSSNSIRGHATREVVEDRYNNIWIGTEDQGLSCWDPVANRFETLSPQSGLSHSNVHGLAIVGDSLLAGTFYRGINVIDVRTKKVLKHFNSENTGGKLGDDFVFHIYRTRVGEVFLATSRGLYNFIPGKDEFHAVKGVPSHIFYTGIFEDKHGDLWLSTWRDGVIKYNPKTAGTQRYQYDAQNKRSLNGNRVNSVFEDSEGTIWVATESGIAIWNRENDGFTRITKKNGLPSNLILAFEEDSNKNIWVSTSNGLVRMSIDKQNMEIYDTEWGLIDLQFNYNSSFKDSNGLLYFGSSKGLIRFDPAKMSHLYTDKINNPIYITGIQTNQEELLTDDENDRLQRSIIYTDKIVLEHDESTIGLDFAALNFISSKSTSYFYRLMGLDTTWTFLRTNDKAKFTKVPPGRYTFEVVAVDANRKPISAIKSLQITVKPPFWKSLPALIIYGLIVIALVWYSLKIYDSRIKEKNRRRLETLKSHKEKELYKAKMDFLAGITHDIKTPLTLIKAPLERLMQNEIPKEKSEQLLLTIRKNTDKLISLTDKLLDFRKVESSQFTLQLKKQHVNKLVTLCINEYAPLIDSKKITLTYYAPEPIEANIDTETIYKIIDNLLSNAVKYSESQIRIDLRHSDKSRQSFEILVSNDGQKIASDDIQQLFKPFHRSSNHYQIEGSGLGLSLSFSYAKLHGGSLKFVENSENLNIFVLEIPI